MRLDKIVCWEPSDVTDPMLRAARRLYEETLAPDERIPWVWIERSIEGDIGGRSRSWCKHLILAAPEGGTADPDRLAGYVYGAFISGYGGYLCYVGVADWARGQGVATRLYEEFYRAVRADAAAAGEPLPFVIWESHRPGPDAPGADRELWQARVRLFDRVGGLWVEGVDFLTPNFADEGEPPVPLQLFVRPMDTPAALLSGPRLREVVAGLHDRVYRNEPGDTLYDGTFPPGRPLRLVPARLAGAVRADRGVLV